ncbi:PP2C family serine/threonine-protein phosphatase [Vreelandella zhanjiangensis]|uniref:PP2C family serine/threonine-protein phosphatase n=1 Tax=Vreelandella zhanjiangensis TaxID=1121960 RepID=UPI00402A97F3
MRRSHDYYRRVVSTLFETPGRRLPNQLVDRVISETEATDLIDKFREQFKSSMSEHFKLAKAGGSDVVSFTPGLTVNDREERAMSEESTDKPGVSEEARLRPGDIPKHRAEQAEEEVCSSVETRIDHLPNGRSGQAYDVSLDSLIDNLPSQLALVDDGGSGLSFTEERRLQGTPTVQGAFQIVMEGRNGQGELILHLQLKLALIPNSRDLWKNLASDPKAPYAKPDEDIDRLNCGDGWHMAMGSQRGRSHAHTGGQRDDHGVIAIASSGWNILIVGDGAGSCEYSRQGSLLATTAARDELLKSLASSEGEALEAATLSWWQGEDLSRMPQELLIPLQQTVITAVHAGHRAITEEAKASEYPVKAFSTTLLLAMHKETPQGHIVVSFGIGDGAVAALHDGDQGELLNTADSGQHAGQTRFLDASLFQDGQGLYQRVKVKVFSALDALVLATDGVTDPKFSSDNEMHDGDSWWALYGELAPALPAPAGDAERDPLQEYLSFFIERHHDDRTVAVLYRDNSTSRQDYDQESLA